MTSFNLWVLGSLKPFLVDQEKGLADLTVKRKSFLLPKVIEVTADLDQRAHSFMVVGICGNLILMEMVQWVG
jgi:hypothetical protein